MTSWILPGLLFITTTRSAKNIASLIPQQSKVLRSCRQWHVNIAAISALWHNYSIDCAIAEKAKIQEVFFLDDRLDNFFRRYRWGDCAEPSQVLMPNRLMKVQRYDLQDTRSYAGKVYYDLFAISRVLPTVPKIRLSCIFCTWFPLRRSDDNGHSTRWMTVHPVFVNSL